MSHGSQVQFPHAPFPIITKRKKKKKKTPEKNNKIPRKYYKIIRKHTVKTRMSNLFLGVKTKQI